MKGLEKTELNIGYVALTDSAPLIVAKEWGFFSRWGLEVHLHKQLSWSGLRDKVHAGLLDAAQMLAPMPLASCLGLDSEPTKVITPLVLSLNGNAITLSENLHQEILTVNRISSVTLPMAAYLLRAVVDKRRQAKLPKLRFATVFPYSCHFYQLRDWLMAANLDEDEVDFVVVSPVNMVEDLQSGEIDGFCVGGPWNAKAVRAGIGLTALTSFDIWQDSLEKVLGMLQSWYDLHPRTALALCAALKQACMWLDSEPTRFEAARLMAQPRYLATDLDVIAPSLLGSCLTHQDLPPRSIPSYNQFSSCKNGSINQPELVRGEWLLKQMQLAGQVSADDVPPHFVSQVFRPDIYQQVKNLIERQEAFDPSFSSRVFMKAH